MPNASPSKSRASTSELRALRRMIQTRSSKLIGRTGETVAIPAPVRTLLAEIVRNMEDGKEVSVIAEHHELTTQRAANLLGVSRPFLVRLVEEGKLPFHKVGSHRRVYLSDVVAYKAKRDTERHRAIRNLARQDVRAGTYDKVILPPGARDQ